MRAYVMISGLLFGVVCLAHVLRVIEEGTRLLTEPSWLLLTALALAMCLWALRLLVRPPARP